MSNDQFTIREIEVINSRWGYQQVVKICLNDGSEGYFEIENIFESTGVSPDELEVLINSVVVISEEEDGKFKIKKYCLSVSDLMEFRKLGKSQMKRINDVILEERYGSIRIILKTPEIDYDINLSSLVIQTCIGSKECSALIGSYINPDFFNVGEKIGNFICKRENTTIKDLNLRFGIGFQEKIRNLREGMGIADANNQISDNLSSGDEYEFNYTESFEKYGGPGDGYGGNLSDDFIDDALGGEPDAYWNID